MDKYIRKWRDESQKSQTSNMENILQNENASNNAESPKLQLVQNKNAPQNESTTNKAEVSQSSQYVQNNNSSNDASLSQRQCKQFFLLQSSARFSGFLYFNST